MMPLLRLLVACAVLVGLAIAFADRSLATWAHGTLRDLALFPWMTRIVEPLPAAAALGLACAGVAAVAGWRPGPWGRALIAACLAVLVAAAIKDQLKVAFGRTWPETWTGNNPSWIANGVFGFFPFHGGAGWASFPSGHTTVAAAPSTVLWLASRRWRWVGVVFVAVVAVGLIGADYHWLSDIIAGGWLGIASGAGMAAVVGGRRMLPQDG
jgi:membrane-associated phospholipid phosphatase